MTVLSRLEAARTARWLRSCEIIGEQPQLNGRPTIYASAGRLRIGDRFRLSSRPVVSHLAVGPQGVLEIGSDVAIAHGAAIAAFERIEIGEGTCMGPFVIVMDTNFHGGPGDKSIQHDCRPIIIGRHCRIGSRVTVTRGAVIGDGTEILAGSVVSSAIPAGVCAGGARARVLGRTGDAACKWDGVAASLAELVRDALMLEALPDLETEPSQLPHWDPADIRSLLTAIERRFAVRLDAATVANAAKLFDIATAVEHLRIRRRD